MRPPLDALEGEEALSGAAAEQVGHHLPNQPCDLPGLPSHQVNVSFLVLRILLHKIHD